MKIKPVFVGVLAGVAGILLLVLYLKRFEQDASGGRRVELLVAVQPIQRGKTINEDMLGTREIPQAYVDDRSIRASDREKIVGLRATSTIPVDVIGVFSDSGEARVLLQHVLVLATGQDTGSDRSTTDKTRPTVRMSTLNLSVLLAESQLLALAMDKGKLTVVIRNPDDPKTAEATDLALSAFGDLKMREKTLGGKVRTTAPTKLLSEQQTK
jgi:pilus assembly protein CpaB